MRRGLNAAHSLNETNLAAGPVLKQLKNPKKLIGNPLLKSKFVLQNNESEATGINLALTLADKLAKAIASLESSEKEDAMHRVLYRTFINPV